MRLDEGRREEREREKEVLGGRRRWKGKAMSERGRASAALTGARRKGRRARTQVSNWALVAT